MPRPNRVLPTGDLAALPLRGLLMGNRGILHDAEGALGTARWRHPHWIACTLAFKDRHRPTMAPGRYTELFFLDEVVSLAAGHRPCAECRRDDLRRFLDAWECAHGARPRAPDLDRALHAARLDRRRQRRHAAPIAALPDGAFILHEGTPALVLADRLHPFGPEGYTAPLPRPGRGEAVVLTPAPTVATLSAGYRPLLHPSAA